MNHIAMELLPLGLFIILVYKIKFVPSGDVNSGHLSMESANMLRGLFAMVVVYHHLAQNTSAGITFRHFAYVGYLAVAVFFFFSGYGLQKKYMTDAFYGRRFLSRRIPTVLIPYAIMTAVYWLAYAARGEVYSFADVARSLWNGSPLDGNSWYIINILIFYFVFWGLMRVCKKRYAGMLVGASVYYVIWAFICRKLSYGGWWYNSTHLLVLGMFWAWREEKIYPVLKKFDFLLIPFGVVFYVASVFHLLPDLLSAVLFVLSVLLLTMKFRVGNRILRFLGNISFEIYMAHGLYILLLKDVPVRTEIPLLWCCTVILCAVVSAYFLHKLFRVILSKYRALL